MNMDLNFHLQRKRLQRDLYFNQLIRFNSFDIGFYLIPEDKVSGDFFGIYDLDGDDIGILIGDVSGKGINSAIIAAFFKSIIRKNIRLTSDPGELLTLTNKELYSLIPRSAFVAAGFYKLNTKRYIIDYSIAGIPNFYFAHNNEEILPLFNQGTRMVLGAFENIAYPSQTLELKKNDILMIYSDGLSEAKAKDGNYYGDERVHNIIRSNKHRESDYLINRIIEDLGKFLFGQSIKDDMLLFIIKANKPDIKSIIKPEKESLSIVQWRTLIIIFLKTRAPGDLIHKGMDQYGAFIEEFRSDIYIINIGSVEVHEDIISRGLSCAIFLKEKIKGIDKQFKMGINIKRAPLNTKGQLDWSIALDSISMAIYYASLKIASIITSQSIYNLSKDLFNYEEINIPESEEDRYYALLSKRSVKEISMDLIDRQKELESLKRFIGQRQGQILNRIIIEGEAGSGKTPFIHSIRNYLIKNNYLLLINSGSPATKDIPFYIWLDPLKSLLNVDTNMTERDIQINNLRHYLLSIRVFSNDIFNTLLYIFGFNSNKPKDINRIFSKFIISYFRTIGQKRPLCFILEDIEHIDNNSYDVLQLIIKENLPLLLIFSYKILKQDYQDIINLSADKSNLHRTTLNPLKQEDIKQYLDQKLSKYKLQSKLIRFISNKIFALTQGNHLFASEIISMIIRDLESGFDIEKIININSFLVTNNVQAIIESRILNLKPDLLRIVQIASVYGMRFPLDFIVFVIGESEDIIDKIKKLSHEGIIYKYNPPDIYIFKNVMYREIIYIGLLEEEKIRLHHLASEFIKNLISDNQKVYSPLRLKVLASKHLESSLNYKDAIIMILDIVQSLKRIFMYEDAFNYLKKGMELIERFEYEEKLYFDLIYEEADILLHINEIQKARQNIDRLSKLYLRSNDIVQYYKINVIKSFYHNIRGEYLRGLKLISRIDLELLTDKYQLLYIDANLQKAKLYNRLGYANRAIKIFQELSNYFPNNLHYEVQLLEGLCDSSLFNGNYQTTILYANKLLEKLKGANITIFDSNVIYYLARAYTEIGNISLSRKYIKDNAVFNKRVNNIKGKAWNYHLLFMYFQMKGNFYTAVSEINRGYAIFHNDDYKYGLAVLEYNLANFYMLLGDYKKAEEYLRLGLRNSKRVKAAGVFFSNLAIGIQLYCKLKDKNKLKIMFNAIMNIYWVTESKFYRFKILMARASFYRHIGHEASLRKSIRVLKQAEKHLNDINSKLYRYLVLGEKLRVYRLLSDFDMGYKITQSISKYWRDLHLYPGSEHYLSSAYDILKIKGNDDELSLIKNYINDIKKQRSNETKRLNISEMYNENIETFIK